MDINIILEPDVSPNQFAELAVEAERFGVRAMWSSNYHFQYDAFLALAPAAAATSKILLGALAVSPWEMHPLKMANAILTLNELSQGRAMIAVSGGGGLLGAIGWRGRNDGPSWPPQDPVRKTSEPDRRLTAIRETIEVLEAGAVGKIQHGLRRPGLRNSPTVGDDVGRTARAAYLQLRLRPDDASVGRPTSRRHPA